MICLLKDTTAVLTRHQTKTLSHQPKKSLYYLSLFFFFFKVKLARVYCLEVNTPESSFCKTLKSILIFSQRKRFQWVKDFEKLNMNILNTLQRPINNSAGMWASMWWLWGWIQHGIPQFKSQALTAGRVSGACPNSNVLEKQKRGLYSDHIPLVGIVFPSLFCLLWQVLLPSEQIKKQTNKKKC